jgi:hypothetical protein
MFTDAANAPIPGIMSVAGVKRPKMTNDSINTSRNIIELIQFGFSSKNSKIELNSNIKFCF